VTAGTALEEEVLEARRNNYLAAVASQEREQVACYGLCAVDVSTGEGLVLEAIDPLDIVEGVDRLGVAELLVSEGVPPELLRRLEQLDRRRPVERGLGAAERLDESFFDARWPEDGERDGAGAAAARLALGYVLEVQRGKAAQLGPLAMIQADQHLVLDAATRRHLDLVQNSVDGKRRGSLLGAIDGSVTAMGARRTARWITAPSRRDEVISGRLDAVAALLEAPVTRERLREHLQRLPDLERLVARVAADRAAPRDLGGIRDGLQLVPELQTVLAELPALTPLAERLDPLPALTARLAAALVDEPPAVFRDGGIVRRGFDAEIDRLIEIAGGAKDTLAEIEKRERERTGITSLKVRYNKVFGYFIEVTRTHLAKVPDDYVRKQTIANGERYITEELKQLEDEILTADERRVARELELFATLCAEVTAEGTPLRGTAAAAGELDALGGFAETAARWNFTRPEFHADADRALEIEEGRHAVVEQFARELGEPFVPNDVRLDCDERQVLIVTGPNMAGKSTVMRQVALIQVLAQAGCFVPARRARLPLCDRVFTRVGASDDVSRGRSTFMVEMIETARILSGATKDSLVLLDEIGRGTSTFDGLSIAWAVTEHLHDSIGCKTLFATHYHELTELARLMPRVKNVHVAVKEWNDQVLFIRRLLDGAAGRSYGIQVARLANLPESVLDRAKEVLANLESEELRGGDVPKAGRSRRRRDRARRQLSLFGAPPEGADPIRKRLAKIEVDSTAPLDAINLLAELKALADES